MPSDPKPSASHPPPVSPAGGAVPAALASDHAGHHGPIHTHCENCGTKLQGPWCHRCGQHDFEFHRSFGHVFLEALESLFHFEGKFFRNIVTLLFRPGRLTAEFNAGKRMPQVPPFRLYLFVSFIFFLLIFLGDKDAGFIRETAGPRMGLSVNGRPVGPTPDGTPTEDGGTAKPEEPRLVDALRTAAEEMRAARQKDGAHPAESGVAAYLNEKARRAFEPENRERLGEAFQHHLPHMLMLCLPFFALHTRMLFRKSGLAYLQHLVLALHFHTFIYLWVLCRNGWVALAGLPGWGLEGWVRMACNTWLYAYPVLMLRRLFANSWRKTLFKALVLAGAYGVTLGVGFFLTAIVLFLVF